MRLLVVTVCCWALVGRTSAAQTGSSWVVIPSSSEVSAEVVASSASRVRAALIQEGLPVWPADDAAARFEKEASAAPTVLSKRQLERWMSLSVGAVDDLAEGENEKALRKLGAAKDISRSSIEELNRDPQRASRVFDTCLYQVRAVLATESKSRARAVARECRQLVPRAEPSPRMHPPAVTDMLGEIDALQAKQTGALRVESVPSGCAARLNGVLLGETPVSIGQVFPGKYRVQVECRPDDRGRVHFVTVGAGRTERVVDARFDDAIESEPGLSLRYEQRADENEHRLADARTIARQISADRAVVVSMPADDTALLELVDPSDEGAAGPQSFAKLTTGSNGPRASDLGAAVRSLEAGKCTDFTSKEPAVLPCPGDEPRASVTPAMQEGRRPNGQFIAGVTLASIGVAGLATGYALVLPRKNAAEEWLRNPADTSAQQTWFDLRGAIIASASVGSAALITAMPLALPERRKTPWWAWLSGGVGLGVAGLSVALGVTAPEAPSATCDQPTMDFDVARACVQRSERTTYALLTGLTAAPLIIMPLVYLFRPNRANLQPRVEINRFRATLSFAGRF